MYTYSLQDKNTISVTTRNYTRLRVCTCMFVVCTFHHSSLPKGRRIIIVVAKLDFVRFSPPVFRVLYSTFNLNTADTQVHLRLNHSRNHSRTIAETPSVSDRNLLRIVKMHWNNEFRSERRFVGDADFGENLVRQREITEIESSVFWTVRKRKST